VSGRGAKRIKLTGRTILVTGGTSGIAPNLVFIQMSKAAAA
jgi:short-subunit dehydrogenase involved in D-alanine esterification of teichoic acids